MYTFVLMKQVIINYIVRTSCFLMAFISMSLTAQQASNQKLAVVDTENLSLSNPNEALKIGFLLLKSSDSDQEKAKNNLLIGKVYFIKSDYTNALEFLFKIKHTQDVLSFENNCELNLMKALIMRDLFLDKEFKSFLNLSKIDQAKIVDTYKKNYYKTYIELIELEALLKSKISNKTDELLLRLYKQINALQTTDKTILLKRYWQIKAKQTSVDNSLEESNTYYQKLIELSSQKPLDYFSHSYALIGYADNLFREEKYALAIDMLKKSLSLSEKLDNQYLQQVSSKNLVMNYLVLNDKANYVYYNNLYLSKLTQIENTEQEAVNTAFNLISQEKEELSAQRNKSNINKLVVTIGVSIMLLIVVFFYFNKTIAEKKRVTELLNYLEVTRNNMVNRYTEKKEAQKKSLIPTETEQIILNKLRKFEQTKKFTNKEMSLANLASQFDTNTKYLSEIINKHYNVNFNTYINKLRVNYIVEKLKTDANYMNYKISYLAEDAGFSSHSSFATVFKSITGIAPVTFIDLLKEDTATNTIKNIEYEE